MQLANRSNQSAWVLRGSISRAPRQVDRLFVQTALGIGPVIEHGLRLEREIVGAHVHASSTGDAIHLGLRDLRLISRARRAVIGIEAYGLQIVDWVELPKGR